MHYKPYNIWGLFWVFMLVSTDMSGIKWETLLWYLCMLKTVIQKTQLSKLVKLWWVIMESKHVQCKIGFAIFFIWAICGWSYYYSHPLYHNLCLLLSSVFFLPLCYELSAVLLSSGEFTWRGQDCWKLVVQRKKEYIRQQKTEIAVKRMRIVTKSGYLKP